MELIGSRGCGSVIVEMALALADLPCRITDIAYGVPGPGRDRLLALNPLGQVPTLVLEDGAVMTESAAILLHLDRLAPRAALVRQDRAFLNRLIWLVAAVYPTFTYGDAPERWTMPGDAAATLRARTDARREALFLHWEAEAGAGPYAMGAGPSALDLYLVAMTRWRPRQAWFDRHAPRLTGFAARASEHIALAPIIARHAGFWDTDP